MGLVACKCPQCGADLEFDESREIMFCQYCGSKILKTNVIQNVTNNITNNIQADNVNVSGHLDADTMFENWLITKNVTLVRDFDYYYATDPRREYITAYRSCRWRYGDSEFNLTEERDDCQKLITLAQRLKNQYPMFASLLDKEIVYLREKVNKDQSLLDEKQQEYQYHQARAATLRKKNAMEDALSYVPGIIVAIVVILLIYLAIANA